MENFKSIQPKSSRFDDVRLELESYGYSDLKETVWCIINDFPEHNCIECGAATTFVSYQKGYAKFCNVTCSNRYKGKDDVIKQKISCTLKKFNAGLTRDYFEERTKKFRDTINNRTPEETLYYKSKKSNTTKKVHIARSDEKKQEIYKKISNSMKHSKKAKLQRIRRSQLGAKALNDFRKTMKDEELKQYNKRFGSKDLMGEKRNEFKEYTKLVWYYTSLYSNKVHNIEKRSTEYHLDHRYSIKQGFLDGISPDIIGHCFNLEIVPAKYNLSKGSKCSIGITELLNYFKFGDLKS